VRGPSGGRFAEGPHSEKSSSGQTFLCTYVYSSLAASLGFPYEYASRKKWTPETATAGAPVRGIGHRRVGNRRVPLRPIGPCLASEKLAQYCIAQGAKDYSVGCTIDRLTHRLEAGSSSNLLAAGEVAAARGTIVAGQQPSNVRSIFIARRIKRGDAQTKCLSARTTAFLAGPC
jgi:hypothetical protein